MYVAVIHIGGGARIWFPDSSKFHMARVLGEEALAFMNTGARCFVTLARHSPF